MDAQLIYTRKIHSFIYTLITSKLTKKLFN